MQDDRVSLSGLAQNEEIYMAIASPNPLLEAKL
jgi:hypothetical protein